jgi:putative ABC transport system ATP-binding protein
MTNRPSIIKLDEVWKIYQMGNVRVEALKGVSLDIKKGEFISITGASGSGKSTIMNLLGALDTPTRGHVLLDNYDISRLSESNLAAIRGRKIGFIFQQFNLIPTLTALENVMLPMEFQDDFDIKNKAIKALGLVDLKDRMHHKPSELSGGQAQRVAIARALVNNPEVILADEPTGNLDSKTGKFIMDFFGELHKKDNKTIILVTHDMYLVKYGERTIVLKDGKIIKGG